MAKQTNQVSNTRATRIAAVSAAYRARARNSKLQQHAIATAAHNQHGYLLAVQQLAAQYGMPVPNTLSVRAPGKGAQQHAPSAAPGACKQVHHIAAQCGYNRAATLAACKAAGINPATAATQFAIAKKAHTN